MIPFRFLCINSTFSEKDHQPNMETVLWPVQYSSIRYSQYCSIGAYRFKIYLYVLEPINKLEVRLTICSRCRPNHKVDHRCTAALRTKFERLSITTTFKLFTIYNNLHLHACGIYKTGVQQNKCDYGAIHSWYTMSPIISKIDCKCWCKQFDATITFSYSQ